jgi:hypothetical protein
MRASMSTNTHGETQADLFGERTPIGSRNPLTCEISGWSWRNPLNLLPLGLLALLVLSGLLLLLPL